MKSHWIQHIRIIYLVMRYNLDEFFTPIPALKTLYFFRYFNPWYIFSNRFTPRGKRLTTALQKAGPLFIKFGQILSTRQDILPADIIEHLTQLQDNVAPFNAKAALHKIQSELGKEKYQQFKHIEATPLASASIAQVHAATLQDGANVVIKILRPHIQKQVERDLSFLRFGAKLLEKKIKKQQHKQTSPVLMVDEVAKMIYQEINLLNEAANAEKLQETISKNTNEEKSSIKQKIKQAISAFFDCVSEGCADHGRYGAQIQGWMFPKNTIEEGATVYRNPQIHIPKIYWEYTTKNILTLQRIYGISITNIDKIKSAGVHCTKLATQCVTLFFTQIFYDNFFHADLHPGNIFVNIDNPAHPIIELVDFGIVGSLNLKDRRYIAQNMTALMEKDYRKAARLHRESGWIPEHINEIAFAHALQNICDPILDKPLKDISLAQLLLGLIRIAKQYEIQLQPQLLLLQKTLLNIESLCRLLDAEFNLWDVTQPMLKDWLREQLGLKAVFSLLRKQALKIIKNIFSDTE